MKKLIILIYCCVPFILSCKQVSKSIEETFKPVDTLESAAVQATPPATPGTTAETDATLQVKEKTINFLTDTSGLIKAEKALKKLPQYAGKEIFIYSIVHFYNDGSISATLQHPQNPKYVDSYQYKDGVWSEPVPQQLSIRDEIQSRLIPLNKISFTSAATVTNIYNEKASHVEGAKPTTSVYISILDHKIRWFPMNIDGSRERYIIEFNTNGTLKKFEQD